MTNNNKKKIIGYTTLLLFIIFLITSKEFISNKKFNLKNNIVIGELKPAFNNNNIAVAFASDDNYAKYLSVAIVSLIDNMSKDYNYDIVILGDKIKDKNKRLLLEQVKNFKNISLRFIDINKYFDENKDVKFYVSGHFTRSAYTRLFIPNIFKTYHKVIYLDDDVLIKCDLVDLYSIDLGTNMIAGVRDMPFSTWLPIEFWKGKEFDIYIQNYLNVKNLDEYINSGVIVYNIKECLNNDFAKLNLRCLKNLKHPERHDQDVINMACNGHIKYLDYRYNFFANHLDNVPTIKKYISPSIWNDIKILHFAGYHPWSGGANYSESICEWLRIAQKSPYFSNKNKQLRKLKFNLIRYKICTKIYRSEDKIDKYKKKIENTEKRIDFLKSLN